MAAEKFYGTCAICGKEFWQYKSDYPDGIEPKYCSMRCYRLASRKRISFKCQNCGKEVEITPCQSHRKFCSTACASAWRRKQPKKVTVGKSGYRYIWLSDGSSIQEHVAIMEAHLGRKLLPNECVHHIDENRSNNSLENLRLMTRGEHSRLHREKEKAKGKVLFGDHNKKMRKPVIGINKDGEILRFESIGAAKKAGYYVSKCLYHGGKTAGGYSWRFDNE